MALFILKSSIYNKWFTVDCNVYFPKGSSCLVHPTEKVTNKTLEDSQRMKQWDSLSNWYQSWWWVPAPPPKIKVSTTKWDLVNILNFKMSMQMCNKTLSYICACFLETLQGNYCNAEKSPPQTLQPCHMVFQPEFFLCLFPQPEVLERIGSQF